MCTHSEVILRFLLDSSKKAENGQAVVGQEKKVDFQISCSLYKAVWAKASVSRLLFKVRHQLNDYILSAHNVPGIT